jgi:ABC-2 type transport system ATP-binding protein
MTLVLEGLVKRFGPVCALDGVSFRVGEGAIFGFLGANGAGKTTTMRIVLGILAPDAGQVTWRGRPVAELPRATWGYLPEERGLYPRMGILDQLLFFASLHGIPRSVARRRALDWLERFGIADYAHRRAEELSKGNQQKVQVIAAVLHDPEVLLLDEPFAGLDPVNVAILKDAFRQLHHEGKTLVFSTHQMELVEELCQEVAIIHRGRLVIDGPVGEVRRATGRRVVRLALANGGQLDWVASLPGVRVTRRGEDYWSLDVVDNGDPQEILRVALQRRLPVTRFELADPSLEEIFIELVGGRAPGEAPAPPGQPESVEAAP